MSRWAPAVAASPLLPPPASTGLAAANAAAAAGSSGTASVVTADGKKRGLPATGGSGDNLVGVGAAVGPSSLQRAVISLHCRYNFTQFLDFSRRVEVERCQGLSTFASSAKQLLSSNIKICVIGPSGIGKTSLVQSFMADATAAAADDAAMRSTSGFVMTTKRVSLVGGLSAEAAVSIFDVGGDSRYDALRLLCAQNCHAIVALYSAHSKLSLVQTATMLSAIEPDLGPQPVVVCGVAVPHRPRDVSAKDAECISARCKASMIATTAAEVMEAAVQATLDTLVQVMTTGSYGDTASGSMSPTAASPVASLTAGGARRSTTVCQQLLSLSSNPTVLDVLLEVK